MKIVKVSAIPMSAPVPEEKRHRTDLGTKVKSYATLIRVETDNGLTGIGAALGTPPIVAAIVEHEFAAECVDEDPMFSERIYERMYNGSRSRPALERGITQADESRRRGVIMEAIAGIDIAVWDVKAKALGIPLYQALGAARSSVRGYASGGWAPGDEAEAELAGYAAKGFTAAKMRVVGRDGFSISNCVRRVKAARRGLGPNVELMIDAHGSLEVATAIKLAKELEPYDIAWFEEPVSPDDHAGQAEVRRSTTIPIASGEREFTRFDFQDLLERRALDIAQPDVARAGGMTEIRRIAALTSAHGVRLAPHAWGSGVLFAASIHVAMAAPNCHILEVSQGYMPMMWELFNELFDIRPDGMVHVPDRRPQPRHRPQQRRRPRQRDHAGARALLPQNQLAASSPRRPSAIRSLPWQPARRSRKSPLHAGGLARTMSASSLPGISGLAASNSATGSSTPHSRRRRCNAPQSDTER